MSITMKVPIIITLEIIRKAVSPSMRYPMFVRWEGSFDGSLRIYMEKSMYRAKVSL